ncbi:preprotein translocase subunit SecY [Clostridium kluyveri]|uniref:Protein translocase subunit SecY n=1 Tax=Clostridium kluyveri TaxID=1534 RepID=A0A1L5F3J1_CLOKL|nr:preprotein translocase subunit SecY [Clostridium kluyveri]APM37575.1 preprotein translocase subunit SecY [Clostridium kluyveri]UZQ52465.1 preprotein translocase subunit SecY [Clostridium kluyveri]
MLSTLRDAWKVPELRKRILFTLLMVIIFRVGNFIAVPGIDTSKLTELTGSGSLLGFYDLLSGGAFSRFSIFAMGVIPFINSSIIMQLLTVAVPRLEQLSKEGEEGRKKIQEYTRYASIPLGVIQGFSIYALISRAGALVEPGNKLSIFMIIFTVTTASTFLMWLGDKITEHGIGNGISLIIFVNIISRFPSAVSGMLKLQEVEIVNFVETIGFIAVIILLLVAVVVMSLSERRIPIQYAGKTNAGRMYKGQSTHIPINVNGAAVIGIIFAISVMQFPMTIGQFWPNSAFAQFVTASAFSPFKESNWQYPVLYFLLTIFFTWFYTEVTLKPEEMAENMNKSSGFIPGIRPGEPTAIYIERVLARVAVLGGAFAGIIAISPILAETYTNFKGIYFGGTGLLIIVNVAIETVRQLQSQLLVRHYHGFLN